MSSNRNFGIGLGIINSSSKREELVAEIKDNKTLQAPLEEGKILEIKHLAHTYYQGEQEIKVLDNADLSLYKGQITALIGPSGAGKSTLLHLAGLLAKAQSGEVIIKGNNTVLLEDRDLTVLRRDYIGFVYQYHYLLGEFTALENIILPQLIAKVKSYEAKGRAKILLERLGLKDRMKHRPSALSGGERQRVAIARALANRPKLLLADEPTGNLDPRTAEGVFNELLNVAKESGLCALIATHNPELAKKCDRIIGLEQGKIVELNAGELTA